MSQYPYQFPEDLTGKLARNRVMGEDQEFATHAERVFVPSGGPFFTDSLTIVNTATGLPLEPLTQYKCLHLQVDATMDSGQQVCTIIIVTDITVGGVTIDYQVVGGRYGEVVTTIKELIDDLDWDRITRISWGTQVYGKPETYPASAHRHPGGEFGDWKRFHIALHNIYQAIINRDHAAWRSVYDYINRTIILMIEMLGINKSDYYNKAEVDALLDGLGLDLIRDDIAFLKQNMGQGGGGNADEAFVVEEIRNGDDIVYTITSSNPNSMTEATWDITESTGNTQGAETFVVEEIRNGDDIVYTITSSNPYSNTSAQWSIAESTGGTQEPETFVVEEIRNGDDIVYTITSSNPYSNTSAGWGIAETLN